MSDLDRLRDQLEQERSQRQIAEWHYAEAVKGGDALHDEVKRLREENARAESNRAMQAATIKQLREENDRLRAQLGQAVEPYPLDIASFY